MADIPQAETDLVLAAYDRIHAEGDIWSQPAQVAGTTRDHIAEIARANRGNIVARTGPEPTIPAPNPGPVVRMRCLITVVPPESEWGDLAPLTVGDAPWLLYYVDGRYYEIEGS